MNLLKNTLNILEIDPTFIVKNKTLKSPELTAEDIIKIIIEDKGNTPTSKLFIGHDQIKIRQALKLVFYIRPKPSPNIQWYLYILSINGFKKCPACCSIKLLEQFNKNKAIKSSNIDSWCKTCMSEYRDITKANIRRLKRNHQLDYSAKYAEASARRRARKLQAIPAWANFEKLKEIYTNCPIGYHVDHWAPLQGKLVCGLHVEYNLQYIKASDNISKSNSFDESDLYYGFDIQNILL